MHLKMFVLSRMGKKVNQVIGDNYVFLMHWDLR